MAGGLLVGVGDFDERGLAEQAANDLQAGRPLTVGKAHRDGQAGKAGVRRNELSMEGKTASYATSAQRLALLKNRPDDSARVNRPPIGDWCLWASGERSAPPSFSADVIQHLGLRGFGKLAARAYGIFR